MANKMMPGRPIQTILLVDDQELVLRELHNYLEKRGYNVLEAQDVDEALLIAECFPAMIQVLVTDLVITRMNGRELQQRLMSLRPDMQVIMTSGLADEIIVELTPQVPILAKPILPKRLLIAIEEVLADPQSERTVAMLVEAEQLRKVMAAASS
jgi:two-component system cell cycle sensor histidine kinase/response regulator CckA